jgi:CrcB protein
MPYLWIAVGSAVGGMARYWCYGIAARVAGETFPWGTLMVNVVGSSFIAFFAALTGPEGRALVAPGVRQFVMPGICGGFTTFSTFSLETLNLARDGQWMKASLNILSSITLCLIGAWLGYILATSMNER